jgi:hypothetical protein
MVNDDESMGVYSSIGGYFIWAQVGHCANRIKRNAFYRRLFPSLKTDDLPRQARDKRKGTNSKTRGCGGCFMQVADVPGMRWAHLDLGDPVRDTCGNCEAFCFVYPEPVLANHRLSTLLQSFETG